MPGIRFLSSERNKPLHGRAVAAQSGGNHETLCRSFVARMLVHTARPASILPQAAGFRDALASWQVGTH
jgi:hypothetical protein